MITLSVNLAASGDHSATAALLKKFAAVLAGETVLTDDGAEVSPPPARVSREVAALLDDGAEAPAAPQGEKRGRGRPPGATNKKAAAAPAKAAKAAPADDEDYGLDDDQGGGDEETSVITASSLRKGAAAKAAAAAEPEDDEDDGLGLDDEDGADDDAGPTLEGDILPAFKKYAEKHGRPKAIAILAKYKVKNVRDLDAKHFPAILTALAK